MTNRPLRILHLTLAADAGGLSRYVLDLMAAMQARGHQVDVAGDDGMWMGRFPFDHYEKIPLNGGILGFRQSVKDVRELLKHQPADLIHTHYRRATLLARRLKSRLPILYTLHLSHMSLRWPKRWLSDWGDHTHVASSDARDWLIDEARVSPQRITLIPHGVDVGRFTIPLPSQKLDARAGLGLAANDRVALFVGRFDYPKNEQWLIDVMLAAQSKIGDLKMIIVGEGPREAELRERIARESLEDRVKIFDDTKLLTAYHAADALLLPSIREGFSLVCAEAMSCGVPCLRTRTSGTRDLIVENVTGRSTPIDRAAFVDSAVEFLSDPDKLREMGVAGAKLIREHFTFDRQVEQTIALYRRLIEQKS
jgi:glycosyltransferase involved in cell wall biosynthesis